MMQDYYYNLECLKAKGIIVDFEKMDSIISDGKIEAKGIDKLTNQRIDGDTVNVEMSDINLQYAFEKVIRDNLNGFAPRRSIPPIKTAIFYAMRKFLNLKVARGGILYIQNLVVRNEQIFSIILDESIKEYKTYHEREVALKAAEKWNDTWEVEETKNYNPKTFMIFPAKLSLYQPLYLGLNPKGEWNDLEVRFIQHLEEHCDVIEWFWVNGAEHMEKNFGIKVNDKKTFQPDFLVKFKDGRIGIFDTKGGMLSEDDRLKSNALQRYIIEERNKGKNIFGGLVVKDGVHFRIFTKEEFIPFKENPKEWEYFNHYI